MFGIWIMPPQSSVPLSVLNPRNLPSFCQKLANPSLPLSAYVYSPPEPQKRRKMRMNNGKKNRFDSAWRPVSAFMLAYQLWRILTFCLQAQSSEWDSLTWKNLLAWLLQPSTGMSLDATSTKPKLATLWKHMPLENRGQSKTFRTLVILKIFTPK